MIVTETPKPPQILQAADWRVCLRPESDSIQVPASIVSGMLWLRAGYLASTAALTGGSDVLAIPWLVTLLLALPTCPLATILRTVFLS